MTGGRRVREEGLVSSKRLVHGESLRSVMRFLFQSANRPTGLLLLAGLAGWALSACKPFQVDVHAKDTIKVDVNIKLDVYQYAKDQKSAAAGTATAPAAAPPASTVQRDADSVLKAQLKRSGDIQTFKTRTRRCARPKASSASRRS